MRPCATYDDVNLVMKLYDLRREARMREARKWFHAHCNFRTVEQFEEACPTGSEDGASFWQVVTYWEMAASFVRSGVLHRDLFFQNSAEMLSVWMRVEPLLPQFRTAWKDSSLLENLEAIGRAFVEWRSQRAPGSCDAIREWVEGQAQPG